MFLIRFWRMLKHCPNPSNEYYFKLMGIRRMNTDIVKNIENNNKSKNKS